VIGEDVVAARAFSEDERRALEEEIRRAARALPGRPLPMLAMLVPLVIWAVLMDAASFALVIVGTALVMAVPFWLAGLRKARRLRRDLDAGQLLVLRSRRRTALLLTPSGRLWSEDGRPADWRAPQGGRV
jgi:hypothetical protein